MEFDLKLINHKIRPYEDSDVQFIIDVDDALLGKVKDFSPMTMQECIGFQKKHSFYVFEAGGTVPAYIVFNMTRSQIYRLCVYPPLWRNGIGTKLLDKAKRFCDTLYIWVNEYELDSQLFLKDNGFLWEETVDGDYKMVWREQSEGYEYE